MIYEQCVLQCASENGFSLNRIYNVYLNCHFHNLLGERPCSSVTALQKFKSSMFDPYAISCC